MTITSAYCSLDLLPALIFRLRSALVYWLVCRSFVFSVTEQSCWGKTVKPEWRLSYHQQLHLLLFQLILRPHFTKLESPAHPALQTSESNLALEPWWWQNPVGAGISLVLLGWNEYLFIWDIFFIFLKLFSRVPEDISSPELFDVLWKQKPCSTLDVWIVVAASQFISASTRTCLLNPAWTLITALLAYIYTQFLNDMHQKPDLSWSISSFAI